MGVSRFYVEFTHSVQGLATLPYSDERTDYPTLTEAMQAARRENGWVLVVDSFDHDYSHVHLYPREDGVWATHWGG